jgi:phospholipid/cholesterol/gamma-HCH transport system substrate-binding protein
MKIRKEFYIGLIATVTLVGAYLGFNFLQGKDLFDRNNKFYVLYNKVAGLSESNSVYLNGFKIGSVSKIQLLPGDSLHRVLVELSIVKDIEVPKSSIAKIQSDFLGVNTISMIFSKSKEMAADGDTLNAAIATTIQEEVSMQMLPIKQKTENMLASLDTVLESIKYVFNKETQRTLSNTFKRIQTTIENIEHSSFTLDTVLTSQKGAIATILSNINSITLNIKNNNAEITRAIGNFASLSDSLAQIDIKNTIEKADRALADFQVIVDKINRGEGSLGQLVNNDTLYIELDAASHELNKLLEDIKLNPQRYAHFSVFGRNPKRNVYVAPDSLKKK